MSEMIEAARASVGVLRDHTRTLGQMDFRERDSHVMAIHRALDALQAEVLALTAQRDAAVSLSNMAAEETQQIREDHDAMALTLQLRDDQVVRTQRAMMTLQGDKRRLQAVLEDYWKMIPPLNRLYLRPPSDALTPDPEPTVAALRADLAEAQADPDPRPWRETLDDLTPPAKPHRTGWDV